MSDLSDKFNDQNNDLNSLKEKLEIEIKDKNDAVQFAKHAKQMLKKEVETNQFLEQKFEELWKESEKTTEEFAQKEQEVIKKYNSLRAECQQKDVIFEKQNRENNEKIKELKANLCKMSEN